MELASKLHALEICKKEDAKRLEHLKSELERTTKELNLSKSELQKWKEMAKL